MSTVVPTMRHVRGFDVARPLSIGLLVFMMLPLVFLPLLSIFIFGTRSGLSNFWAALRTIRAGTTLSYGALARQLGRPKSVRAVGSANGANPVAIVIPCHRVIGTDGSLSGYGGGLSRKRWLLIHEGVALEKFATRRIPETA